MDGQKQGTTGPNAAALELEALIARTALRDKKAFSDLYRRTNAKLFGVCFRILNDRSEAEDVLQEIYIKIWHKADQFATGRASVVAWMATIARNQAIDRYRARGKPTDDLGDHHDIQDDMPNPEQAVDQLQQKREIDFCLENLNQAHASAVRHTYLSGWSYQEAADKLDVPINTVKTWIRRSLMQLKECLQK